MAVTYATLTLKDPRMQLVSDVISGKTPAASTGSAVAGKLVIGTSSLSGATGILATITLSATAGTVTPSSGALAFSGTPLSATASAGSPSTAAKAEFRTSGDVVVISGLTVGTSNADINLNSTSITAGQTVTITSGTITHG